MVETTAPPSPAVPVPALDEQVTISERVHIATAWAARNKVYVLLTIIGFVIALFWIFTEDVNPSTEDAQVDGHSIVIAPRVPGYVQKMLIDDNTHVRQCDLMN